MKKTHTEKVEKPNLIQCLYNGICNKTIIMRIISIEKVYNAIDRNKYKKCTKKEKLKKKN